jgi:uncharacterized SAM-binding protein YcdF (DUF218 family)
LEHFLHHFFSVFIKPENTLFWLFLTCAFLFLANKNRLGKIMFFTGVAFFCVTGVSPVGPWALRTLEDRFTPPHPFPTDIKGMIILGGSFKRDLCAARGTTCYNSAAGRFQEALRLAQTHPDLPVLFTGGGVAFKGGTTEASLAKHIAQDLGLDLTRFIFEDKSTSTVENALLSYQMVQPKPGDKWLLVTSANHIPRAVGNFRRAGWQVVPYPVDYKSSPELLAYSFTIQENLQAWSLAVREWASLIRDYLMGRAPVFFPKP